MSDPGELETKKKLIQRWIGSTQTGNLNDPETVAELLKDVSGLQAYLIKKLERWPQAANVPGIPWLEQHGVEPFTVCRHETKNKSKSFNPRGILFHHSGGSTKGTLSWIKNPVSKVSYHVLIAPDGTRHTVVDIDERAWHAGRSRFIHGPSCNRYMIGVAFTGSTYSRDLTTAEINSACEYAGLMTKSFGFGLDAMTDHRTVSPGRKNDLNPKAWKILAAALKRSLAS